MTSKHDAGQIAEKAMLKIYPGWLKRFKNQPLLLSGLWFVSATSFHAILALIFGVLVDTPNVIDFTEDFNYIFVQVGLSAGIYYYFMLPSFLGHTFNSLYEQKVLISSKINVDKDLPKMLKSKWLMRIPFILTAAAIGGWTFWVIVNFSLNSSNATTFWWGTHPILFISVQLIWFVAQIFLAGVFVEVLLATYLIRKIVQDADILVYPLHADNCGGFSPLGNFLSGLVISQCCLVHF